MRTAINQFAAANANAIDRSSVAFNEGLRRHMLRVYNYMGVGLIITGVAAFVVGTTPAIYEPIFSTPLSWVVILAPLAFVVVFSLSINAISAVAAQIFFWAFCAVMGISLASVFILFTGASIARTFFIAAGMFGAMSIYGYTTKSDLTKFGSFLIMGLVGIVIASVANLFLGSSTLHIAISFIGILLFLGLTAWDTQTIRNEYANGAATGDNQKLAVLGALSLYLNFVNLFQFLLSFTGQTQE
jgi:FtsH-binding integral membrane protein